MGRSGWGEPPWRVELEPRPTPPPARCDAAVVGAGFTGLAAALQLARSGLRVVVLEAQRIGSGASGRSGGIALEGTHQGELPGADRCLDGLRSLVDEHGIDCDLALRGCAELVHGEPPASSRGEALAWRDAGRTLQVAGRVAGGVLDPGRLLDGLARAALAAGARVCEGAAVRELAPEGAVYRLATARGVTRAERVLLALNAYTAELLALPHPPISALTLALCTQPLSDPVLEELGLDRSAAFYTLDLPYLWGRVIRDGRLVLGGGLLPASSRALAALDLARGEARTCMQALERRLRGLHPLLADVAATRRWGGPVALLRERPPVLARPPRLPRLALAAGYSGHGVAASLQFGALAARSLAEERPLPAWGVEDATAI